jgi:hypothetical protein
MSPWPFGPAGMVRRAATLTEQPRFPNAQGPVALAGVSLR